MMEPEQGPVRKSSMLSLKNAPNRILITLGGFLASFRRTS